MFTSENGDEEDVREMTCGKPTPNEACANAAVEGCGTGRVSGQALPSGEGNKDGSILSAMISSAESRRDEELDGISSSSVGVGGRSFSTRRSPR